MPETLGERQAAILRAAVREYVRSGEPVGSKHLLERTKLDVSSATVRNDMARLEEMGYLAQPHTSAGRIPTDLAYRFIVDEIKAPKQLAEPQRRAIENELAIGSEPASIDEILKRAGDVVSRFTHHATAVLTRRERPALVRRVEAFRVGGQMAMVVVIADNGRVEQRVVPLDATVTDRDVEALNDELSRDLHGVRLEDALRASGTRIRSGPARERSVINGIAAALEALLAIEDQVYVGGVANLAGRHDFERSTLLRLYEALERQTEVLRMLTSALDRPVSVTIGSEGAVADFRSCSVVVANFGAVGETRGQIGVIGPTRMDYERVISTANVVARMLEQQLHGPSDES